MIVYPSVFYAVPFPYPFLIFAVFEPKYLTIYLPWIFVQNLFEIGQLATKWQPIMWNSRWQWRPSWISAVTSGCHVSAFQISSKSVNICPRYSLFSKSNMAAAAILDLHLCFYFRFTWGQDAVFYNFWKFYEPGSFRMEIMQHYVIFHFGWDLPNHAHFLRVLGANDP